MSAQTIINVKKKALEKIKFFLKDYLNDELDYSDSEIEHIRKLSI